jgi:predicted ATPase
MGAPEVNSIALHLGEGESRLRAHYIGQQLGFDFSASAYILPLGDDAQQLRDRARQYLAEYFRSAANDLPVVFFLEDLHWADDSS